ncbi:UDP-N-acetylglucosamine--LPS N-acetylglucosamine transferase [Pseudactinotalea sp. HY160]|nr:UDP-N-acetylglucosamine--LPS N-acetylglucosamine transferase [Pseudactinotalea sp. HY160]
MSSNGAGMGHLTRLFSYARRLDGVAKPHILSLSQAVPVADRLGYPYEYLPSSGALQVPAGRWKPLFIERVTETIARIRPSVVVFDGTWPYRGIEQIREAEPGPRWLWSRRGMWRHGMNLAQLDKSAWFDAVFEPGDLAAAYDQGVTVGAQSHRVSPVTLLDPSDLLDRASARAALGLPESGPLGLISLGAGNINDTSSDIGVAAQALVRNGVGVCVTLPDIAVTSPELSGHVHVVRDYPLSRCYRAFDVVVSAAGYNSFHELLRFGVPALFIPNRQTSLDDQAARARFAADSRWAFELPRLTLEETSARIASLLEDGSDMVARAHQADPGNGAPAVARLITRAIDGTLS